MKLLAAIALLLAGCTTAHVDSPSAKPIRIDHVIVGAADLDAAIVEMERLTAVRPVIGGIHPRRGTRNALMSLGDGTYLEILAPDPAQAVAIDELRDLRALPRLTPVGWAVSANEEAPLRSVLAAANIATSGSVPGSRAKPDGSVLHWVTFGYSGLDHLLAPFFIVWDDQSKHPSRTSPAGCRLTGLAIDSPEAPAIARAVAPLGLAATVAVARRNSMRIALTCRGKEVSF